MRLEYRRALSIWLVIYALLLGFVVWQFRSATPRCSEIVKRIGWLFVAGSACRPAIRCRVLT